MNILGKIGFALLISGGLIINGTVIMTILRLIFKTSIPWYVQLVVVVIITGFLLMFLSVLYDRYKSVKAERQA
jgi:membrane protein implicated in regulation of membrane protease activity